MIINRLLVRYRGGWLVAEDAASIATWGPAEQALSLGDIDDATEARRVAEAHLATMAQPEMEIVPALDLHAASGAVPWQDCGLGDWVTVADRHGSPASARVVGWTIAEDQDGVVTIELDLHSVIDEHQIAAARWLRRMAPGGLGGRSDAASPAAPADSIITRRPTIEPVTFSFAGPLEVEVSPPWQPSVRGRLAGGLAMLGTPSTNSVQLEVLKNGGVVATIDFAPGAEERVMAVNVPWLVTDVLTLRVSVPTDDAESLTVKMQYLHYEN